MITCIYRPNCRDCLMAAAVIALGNQEEPVVFREAPSEIDVHEYESQTVYLVGIAYPEMTMRSLASVAEQLVIFNNNAEKLPDLELVADTWQREESAICMLAWRQQNSFAPTPLAVMWLDDLATGSSLLETHDFERGLRLEPKKVTTYLKLVKSNTLARAVSSAGKSINRYLALPAEERAA